MAVCCMCYGCVCICYDCVCVIAVWLYAVCSMCKHVLNGCCCMPVYACCLCMPVVCLCCTPAD